ncbi:uncharacterized protein LOC134272828 [Saccostrea cucullata]|uniref:uncharacterized protein LOC134265224 n=1 Tax=Saccostrea cuccullata TaxID=36930 RepID=UPI002ED296A6
MAEMKRFIAMGFVVQLDISEYWTTSVVNSTPFSPSVMPRDRFWLLMCFFHLANNNGQLRRGNAGQNPLYKLGSLYKNIVCSFGTVFRPHQHLSMDEEMVPWRGNLSFRVHNPDKPKKNGIKAYMLCDAVTGYCLRFKLYTGKSGTPDCANGYHDRKVVYLLSTIEEAAKAPCGRVAPRTGTTIENPAIVNAFKYMGGVDRSDQMVSGDVL